MKMLRRASPAPVRSSRPARASKGAGLTGVGKRLVEGVQQFVYDTRTELKKVVWPTREQTINLTALVIAVSAAVAAFIGAVDFLVQKFFQLILGGA